LTRTLAIAIDDNALLAGNRAMAADRAREDEAITWTEGLIGDSNSDDQ
jgi:hypothetical protein